MILFNKVLDADKVYLVSDCHISHRNICKGVSSWDDKSGCRDFNSLEEMNNTIIDNINAVVPADGILINLGDIIFGDKSKLPELLGRINCKNHHLVFGNHDQWMFDKPNVLSMFSSTQFYLEFFAKWKGKNHKVCCQHYSQRVWHDSHKGSVLLYGHSHGSISNYGKSLDVGVDTNMFKPYKLTDILTWAESQPIIKVDHH